jgi:hypothetical protein
MQQSQHHLPILSKFKPSINLDIIDFKWFGSQIQFIHIIEQVLDGLNLDYIIENPNAVHLFEKYLKLFDIRLDDLDGISKNENAIFFIEQQVIKPTIKVKRFFDEDVFINMNHIEYFWEFLSKNPNGYEILKKNIDKINWIILAYNPNITTFIENLCNGDDLKCIKDIPNFNKNFITHLALNRYGIELFKKLCIEFEIDYIDFLQEMCCNNYYKEYEYNLSDDDIVVLDLEFDERCREYKYKFSQNPNAISIIKKNSELIDWHGLSSNCNAIDLIEEKIKREIEYTQSKKIKINDFNKIYYHPDDINWDHLSSNVNAISILSKNVNKINWDKLSSNQNAIEILGKNLDKVNWHNLSLNPKAIVFFDNLNFENLSDNDLLTYLIKIGYLNKINNVYEPSFYTSEFIQPMLDFEEHENVDDEIPSLKGHFLNNIFEVDYKFLKDRMESTIGEELMKVMFHPKNLDKFQDWGF